MPGIRPVLMTTQTLPNRYKYSCFIIIIIIKVISRDLMINRID